MAVLVVTAVFSYAQTPEFYVEMENGEPFEGVSCVVEETQENGFMVWNVTMKNDASVPFQPVKAGLRLGIDTYMDKYPEWLDKYFPTLLYCSRTHFYGYLQTPGGKILAVVSKDPIASWSVDYNLAYQEPEGYWFYGHRIGSVNLDLINALPLPSHHPQDRWRLLPGQSLEWKIMFIPVDELSDYENAVHEVAGIPMIRMRQTSYSPGQTAVFEVLGRNPEVFVFDPEGKTLKVCVNERDGVSEVWCRLREPGLYTVEVKSEGYVTEGNLTAHRSWEWTMRKAREGALTHKQRATSHVESWYGYHTAFLAARYFPEKEIDETLSCRFERQMKMLYGEDLSRPLHYEWRIQNTASTIGMFVDRFEAYGNKEDIEAAVRLADWLIGYAQKRDDAYRNKWKTIYTSVIYVAKSILELCQAESKLALTSVGQEALEWQEASRRHYASAKRAIDQLVASQGDFHTEGEITFEDGMISCSALQMGLLALMQTDREQRKYYTDAMLDILNSHDCLVQLQIPDARRRGGTMRYWEAQYDVHMMPNMFNSPHGWSAWRAYATYYAYLLTGEERWLLETWNAMGAFANLIDSDTGELRWAFVLDPYVKAKQMHEPVAGIDPDSLDFGNPHPDMYSNREFVFGEDYVPMVSSWQTRNSQDNDVHEVFKCLGETFLTNAFVVEREDGSVVGYNCEIKVRGDRMIVKPHEEQIVNLHLNLHREFEVVFCGQTKVVEAGFKGWMIAEDLPLDRARKPQAVIFDTDMGNDIDDALALQMLLNYQRDGLVDIKGITICKANPLAIEFVDSFCRYNCVDDIPLGYVYDGPNPDIGNFLLPTLSASVNGKPLLSPVRNIDSGVPRSHEEIFRLLKESEDKSVVLIATGPLTNIARLLEMEGGEELMRSKVSRLCLMSGDFRGNGAAEWNVLQDKDASRVVYERCPVPLTTSGFEVGKEAKYPATSIMNDFGDPVRHPLCVAYSHFLHMPYDRPTWDLTTVLDAVEPSLGIFARSPKGWIRVDDKGVTTFTEDPEGLHEYLILDQNQNERLVNTLVDCVR